jgi:hypothetical protein
MHSPSIAKLEIVSRGHVRRAKLYYLRELRGKKARIKERRIEGEDLAAVNAAAVAAGLAAEEAELEEPVDGELEAETSEEGLDAEAPVDAEADAEAEAPADDEPAQG